MNRSSARAALAAWLRIAALGLPLAALLLVAGTHQPGDEFLLALGLAAGGLSLWLSRRVDRAGQGGRDYLRSPVFYLPAALVALAFVAFAAPTLFALALRR